jgi:predicted metal-dependent phosphoesterase TrpH
MNRWSFVGHVHTRYSFDSLTHPRALAARALASGVDVLAVTDHDTWRGAVDTLAAAEKQGGRPRVVIGSEVHTDQGDVIGLFLKDDIRERRALRFCDAVHEHDGLVLLPHPYRWHRLDEELLRRVDLIEVFNSRTSKSANDRAARLAEERGVPGLAGPDAHRLSELGLARVEFEGELPPDEAGLKHALLHAPRRFHTRFGSMWNDWLSVAASLWRYPSGRLAWRLVRDGVRHAFRPGSHEAR